MYHNFLRKIRESDDFDTSVRGQVSLAGSTPAAPAAAPEAEVSRPAAPEALPVDEPAASEEPEGQTAVEGTSF
ncbi:MAG: hypothetical protein GF334_03665 [Candidatus Altiarchaeales archaeon]|nr:hypothetical protein [Candidatus Altiarchaeales archaeon]